MLGVAGAIAFAAATSSWAQDKGSAAPGASAQTGAQTKATGSKARMTTGKMSGRAASSEGMKTGHMKTSGKTGHMKTGHMKTSGKTAYTSMRSSRTHVSSKVHLRTRTRTSAALREARLRDQRVATGSVGTGVNTGFANTGFYGYGSPGFGFAPGYGYPGYAGYRGYAAGYPGCTCGAPGVAWGYRSPAYS